MKINLLIFKNYPILEQLKLEEALLRTGKENWMILNMGSPKAVVMGLSSSADDWVKQDKLSKDGIPLIQRFSGGGTVFVDEDTIFASWIINRKDLDVEPFPKPILRWTADFYKKSLNIPLTLKENDYTLGNKKIGGNAQYLKKDRWLHHTTFLQDVDMNNMDYLRHPKREPDYRKGRNHSDFITTLAPYLTKEEFKERLVQGLKDSFTVEERKVPTNFPDHRSSITVYN